MKKKSKLILLASILVIALIGLWAIWAAWLSPTHIAFVNFQTIEQGSISKANTNSFIKLSEVSLDKLDRLNNYDMVFVNGMGLRIVEEQRRLIQEAAAKGVPLYTSMATNPANNICNLDTARQNRIQSYLSNGGKTNYRNMLNYIRKEIDGKGVSAPAAETPVTKPSDILYHANVDNADDELEFLTVAGYEKYLRENSLYKPKAPRIAVTGQMADATGLIDALEKAGYNVYPVRSMRRFMSFIGEIAPDAVINMAHGRMGDAMVEYLKARNILLFAPLTVNSLTEEWENDPMGMSGGFMSQSIVTPEIDGALRPFALFAQYENEEGLRHSYTVPGRLKDFVATIDNYFALKSKPNREKRVAIYYYKGPGQNALTASGMEVVPSLYNLLLRMQKEGYDVSGLPTSAAELGKMIQAQGAVFGNYAQGAFTEFMKSGHPQLITRKEYESWVKTSLRQEKYAEVVEAFGEFPGEYMATSDGRLGVARLQFGNVVLLPQNTAGKGDNVFQVVHGTDAAPPHTYIASYLWTRYGFKADALIHFGTHGSLEYTPKKQVALSDNDWPDRLVGTLPHFYLYTIGNVGEAMIAKRRSYAGIQSYLTPPFMESSLRGTYRELMEQIKIYNDALAAGKSTEPLALAVKSLTMQMGIHHELGLDSLSGTPYTEEEITRIENFAEELATEKITGQLYTLGVPYTPERITSSVFAMATEPIAYSLLALDRERGKATEAVLKRRSLFTQRYLTPARSLVEKLLANPSLATDELICRTAGITPQELARTRDRELLELARTIRNVTHYRNALQQSPEMELQSLMNALNSGYTAPTPGGDPIANPNTLPTGRNLYSINAEATPSESAWEKGVALAKQTIDNYRRRHNDSIPRKVSYTLWSSEFIETEGATIAQVLYMLGVEPVRDAFGRVSDLKLIPSAELGRPRIDVVVQTSGQLRDLAASRLFLINRAVEMAAAAKDDAYENQVASGMVEAEKILTEKGLTPKEAREMSTYRVFGGMNGMYGTGIQQMVESGDRWEKESEIASTYLHNMGAYYGSKKNWEAFQKHAFEAALTRTDIVVQPRQSNTWGALSLDHVYEFMGGMNLAVRHVTGKDPDAYLSDYRNRHHTRMQELKEAVGVESRTTLLNPAYIREKMKGEASSADELAEIITNTYGWNVMKPAAIDKELWDRIYKVYVEDEYSLGTKAFFEQKNPAALEEMTAVMLESIRKGLWQANDEQTAGLARLHTELVNKYRPSCSGFVCDNAKLRDFIASKTDAQSAALYKAGISQIREAKLANTDKAVVMKKQEIASTAEQQKNTLSNITVGIFVLMALIALVFFIRRRRNNHETR